MLQVDGSDSYLVTLGRSGERACVSPKEIQDLSHSAISHTLVEDLKHDIYWIYLGRSIEQ